MDDLKLEKVIYKYKDKEVELKADYVDKELYLTAKDMSKLFDKDESNIRKIIVGLKEKNRYQNSHLNIKNSPVQVNFTYTEHIIELTASDGKIYKNVIYNSSVIFALGLKLKSEIVMDLKEFMDGLFKENSSVLKCNLSLNNANNYEIVKYDNGEITISINVDYNEETVWLTQEEISSLFLVSKSTISYHISNILMGKS